MAKQKSPEAEAREAEIMADIAREKTKKAEQEKRERQIAQCHEMIGQIKGANLLVEFGSISGFLWLKQVKESKLYKDLPDIGTWESFCNYLGKNRRLIDEQLLNLNAFGEKFLDTLNNFRVGYRDLKKLRRSISDGQIAVTDEAVEIAGDRIPLAPDYKDDLQAAIESLIEEKDRQIEEKEVTIRAKDRVLQAKDSVIKNQEHELKHFKWAEEFHKVRPQEEACLKNLKNQRIAFEGFMLALDPAIKPLPEDATERMKAAYVEFLGYIRRLAIAYYDTATEYYGIPNLDDDFWTPEHLRPGSEWDPDAPPEPGDENYEPPDGADGGGPCGNRK